MEITNFLTQSFLTTYTGTLVAVELMVFVTKSLPLIKKIPTRVYTFAITIIHSVVINVINGTLESSLKFYYLLFINALVITVTLCGGYDVIVGNANLSLNKRKDGSANDSLSNTKDTKKYKNENNKSANNNKTIIDDKSSIPSNVMVVPNENTDKELKNNATINSIPIQQSKGQEKNKNDTLSDFSTELKEKSTFNLETENSNEQKTKNIIKNAKGESLNAKGGLDISNYLNVFE